MAAHHVSAYCFLSVGEECWASIRYSDLPTPRYEAEVRNMSEADNPAFKPVAWEDATFWDQLPYLAMAALPEGRFSD